MPMHFCQNLLVYVSSIQNVEILSVILAFISLLYSL
jgi:hypothetical protein